MNTYNCLIDEETEVLVLWWPAPNHVGSKGQNGTQIWTSCLAVFFILSISLSSIWPRKLGKHKKNQYWCTVCIRPCSAELEWH